MQLGAKAHCANIYPYPIYFVNTYPSYPFITPAKKKCYASDSNLVSEISAEIVLKSLINYTVSRLLESSRGDTVAN